MATEAEARATLLEMQTRLERDPYTALGILPSATPADIRHAFLSLTKRFHPARFARMPNDIQRLSNEVFLALRAAHDAIAKPVVRAAPPPPTPAGPPSRPSRPQLAATPAGSTKTPAPSPTSTTNTAKTPVPTPVSSAKTPAPVATKPAPQPAPRHTPPSPLPAIDKDLAPVYEMIKQLQWQAARSRLENLASRAPGSNKYRALIHYTLGREAQLAKRLDEARVELHTALELDPDLQLAKSALGELFARRR